MEVDIYSRDDIIKLLNSTFSEKIAVISFCDPVDSKMSEVDLPVDYLQKIKRVFSVAVHDVDIEELSEFGMTYDTYFPEALDVAKFIYASYKEGFNIICQCEYGQSRSAGCAAAILEYFYHNGISIFADYRYCPNQMIFHKVYDALEDLSLKEIEISENKDCLIGIWWYTDDGEIWAVSVPKGDGVLEGPYLQYSSRENHMTLWRQVVSDNSKSDPKTIIAKGYKTYERGRVIYNCRTSCYEVTCSGKLICDKEFRRNIIDYFKLSGNQVEFIRLNHYHREELVGNPVLDEFYYNSDM